MLKGLLDFAKTPEGQGLLGAVAGYAATANRAAPVNSLGRGALAGLLAYGNAQDRQVRFQQEGQERELRNMQIEQARRGMQTQQAIRDAAQAAYRAPVPATGQLDSALPPEFQTGAVPTPAQPGGFDTDAFVNRVMQIDPMKGLELRSSLTKEIPVDKVSPKDFTPESIARFSMTRNYGDLVPVDSVQIAPNGVAYSPRSTKPGTVFSDFNKPFVTGPDGKPVPNTAFQNYEFTRAREGAARTNVNVDTAPKAFWGDFGRSANETLFKEREAAQAAASMLSGVNEIRQAAASGAYQGAGAELKLGAAKALNALGFSFDQKTIANTEQFNANAKQFVLNQIKMLGANPSNADRDFIEKTVPSLSTDPNALPKLLDFMEGKARSQVGAYNTKIRGVQQQPGAGFMPFSLEVQAPEPYQAPAAAPKPTLRWDPQTRKLVPVN